ELDLKMVTLGEPQLVAGMLVDEWWINKPSTSFPAMLSIRDISTNRPGYLHHLSGLKQLKELRGSISAETDETKVTMGWAEVKWIDQNWPELRKADFFKYGFNVNHQFRWLQDKRMSEGRVPLKTFNAFDDGL
ncbi:hypothetical protein BGZ88_007750, partial [Linnemannia elongata]